MNPHLYDITPEECDEFQKRLDANYIQRIWKAFRENSDNGKITRQLFKWVFLNKVEKIDEKSFNDKDKFGSMEYSKTVQFDKKLASANKPLRESFLDAIFESKEDIYIRYAFHSHIYISLLGFRLERSVEKNYVGTYAPSTQSNE